MSTIKLSPRQQEIIKLVKENPPITSEKLASKLNVTRAALRPDLAILTMTGILEARPKVGYIYSQKPSNSILYEYIRKMKVKDIMTKPVVTGEETKVYDAIVYLFLNDVGTLFIENNGCLVGAVSRKDFLKIAIGGTDMHQVPVGVIMTRMPNIIYVDTEDLAYVAAKKIIEHEVDSLPVVEKFKEGNKELYKIVGKVSKTNITKLFVKLGD
ncbi:CBS domain-containing protein [Clostridium acidisoli DSM 12555]|uniref:CBS domain-containing protein n=1 Tax=Clostridium acidisoli DSM 12555 TaxID=1121291 RepID=A0A1W1X4L8_9CLOT|nr:helix-turn-helix transcriptional regulator [Clostridium acidisoli]SMC18909.1 CBS domain-containing protein [Clostridium acidisoli DSM 12555]